MSKTRKAITGRAGSQGCVALFGALFFLVGFCAAMGYLSERESVLLIVGGIFMLAGGVIAVLGWQGKIQNAGSPSVKRWAEDTDASASRTPRRLKAKHSPIAKVVGIILAALFWNGIVGVFVYNAIPEAYGGSGEFPWFAGFFLIPFVLVGLLLIGAVFHQILALWNPRPEFTLDPGAIRLGETATIEWSFTGNVRRIQNLVITLEGTESATYRQGTNTRTDTSTFMRIPVAETGDHKIIRLGKAEVPVPEFTAPTFSATNNKIIWALKVKGDIPKWPDVSEEYEIRILPLDLQV